MVPKDAHKRTMLLSILRLNFPPPPSSPVCFPNIHPSHLSQLYDEKKRGKENDAPTFLKPPSTPHFPISGGERSEKKTCFAILPPPCGSFSSRTSASAPSFPDWRREPLVIRGKIFCSLSVQGGSRELGLAVSGREGRKGGKWRRRRGGSLVYFPLFPRRGERGGG